MYGVCDIGNKMYLVFGFVRESIWKNQILTALVGLHLELSD